MPLKTDEIILKRKAVIMAITAEGGIGPKMFQQILMHVGPPEDILGVTEADLEDIPRLTRQKIEQILKSLENVDDYVGKINDYMSNEIQTTCILDDDYPESLRSIDSPPPLLYYRGDKSALNRNFIALVGTTKATQGGLRLAVDIARELTRRGYGIVSGLAAGIDSAAHLGALKEQGVTVAVLGCGLLEIYPEENKPLAELIARSGLLISEHQPFRKVSKSALVLRNRIISAMAGAVVVVQVGSETQGELRTAGYAAQQARPLFYGDPEKDLDYERFKEWPGVIIDSADSVDEIINYVV